MIGPFLTSLGSPYFREKQVIMAKKGRFSKNEKVPPRYSNNL